MGRPRIEWTEAQLGQILAALPALNRDTQQDNARFLDGVIAVVRTATGRLYGATTYSKLLQHIAPQAGIERTPSSSTVQAAVLRAQSLAAQPETNAPAARDVSAGASGVSRHGKTSRMGGVAPGLTSKNFSAEISADMLRSALIPAIREVLAPVSKRRKRESALTQSNADAPQGDALQLRLTQAALADAYARIRRLEQDAAQLRRELGHAEAARDLAGKHVNAMLAGLHDAIVGAGSSAEAVGAQKRKPKEHTAGSRRGGQGQSRS